MSDDSEDDDFDVIVVHSLGFMSHANARHVRGCEAT